MEISLISTLKPWKLCGLGLGSRLYHQVKSA